MAIDNISPKNGGRNIQAVHGTVTGNFMAFFNPNAGGATFAEIGINGSLIDLPSFGLDQIITSAVAFIGTESDVITSVRFANGGGSFYNATKPIEALMLAAEIDKSLPAGYNETLGVDFVKTRTVDGTEVGSFPTYYKNTPIADQLFVVMSFDIKSDRTIDLPFYVINVNIDGTDTGGNSIINNINNGLSQHFEAGRIIMTDPAEGNASDFAGVSLENYNDTQEANIEITNIKYKVQDNADPRFGVGQSYTDDDGSPDESVVHANHSFAVDTENQMLVCTATGAGTSYFLWNRDFTSGDGVNTGAAYARLGQVTAAGANVNSAKDGGVQWFALNLSATDAYNSDSTKNGMNPVGATKFGFSVVTTGAGIIEIKKWIFLSPSGDLTIL